jgi:hypothetical protein
MDADSQRREWFPCSTAKPAARSHQRRASATSASALSATTAVQRIRSSMGEREYEREWKHPFPKEAFQKVEKAVLSV